MLYWKSSLLDVVFKIKSKTRGGKHLQHTTNSTDPIEHFVELVSRLFGSEDVSQ